MRFIICSFILYLSIAISASATPITYTGAQLLQLNALSLPQGNPQVFSNQSIAFNAPPDSSIFLSLRLDDLIDNPRNFSVSANFTRRSQDLEIFFGLSDGNSYLAAALGNDSNGVLGGLYGSVNARGSAILSRTSFPLVAEDIGIVPFGNTFTLDFTFTASLDQTVASITAFDDTGTIVRPTPIDSSRDLSLIWIADSNSVSSFEIYHLNSITLTSQPEVQNIPEPGTLVLTGLPLAGMVGLRYRRRKPRG